MPRSLASPAVAFAVLLLAGPARADMAAPPPPQQRAAMAETVVVGKVVSIEEKTVGAKRYPGDPDKGEYQIAVVKIDSAILGAKGLTHVRVGFIPQADDPKVKIRRPPPVQLKKDDEVILFLQPHFEANFHVAPAYYDGVFKRGDGKEFEKTVEDAKRVGKLLSDPQANLTAKDAKDRFETAALLIVRYRRNGLLTPTMKEQPIDAKESKLILEALAEADWGKGETRWDALTPMNTFAALHLTPKDGWTPPQDLTKVPDAAKKWLKDNADTYRIKKFVEEKKEK
jgi:hypothetical protein